MKLKPAQSSTAKKPFDSLSKPEKRVAIAKDVIAQLTAKKIIADTGVFVQTNIDNDRTDLSTLGTTFGELMKRNEGVCSCCALGSLMLSQLNVNGDCPIEQVRSHSWYSETIRIDPYEEGSSKGFSPFIRRYFSEAQLQMIEVAFEHGDGAFTVESVLQGIDDMSGDWEDRDDEIVLTESQARKSYDFGLRFDFSETKKRLLAIMQNIIDHEGTFTP